MTKLLGYVEIPTYLFGSRGRFMKLTSKGRYAVTAMLDVAIHSAQGPVPLADISERQGISLSYLEQLFAKLRKQGLVAVCAVPVVVIASDWKPTISRWAWWYMRWMNLSMPPVVRDRGIARVAPAV